MITLEMEGTTARRSSTSRRTATPFVTAMNDARRRVAVDLFGNCLLPNQFHLVLRPHGEDDMGRWRQRRLTAPLRDEVIVMAARPGTWGSDD